MEHQGAGRPRPAGDTRRGTPWPPQPDSGDSGVFEGTGALPVRPPGPGGPQPVTGFGSGGQPVAGFGSGGQPVLGGPGSPPRNAARGFPPGRGPAEPPQDAFGGWHTPGDSLTGPLGHDPEQTNVDGISAVPPEDDTDPYGLAVPPGLTGPEEQEPAGRGRRGGRTKRRSRVALLATVAVVAAAAGFAGYKYLYEPRVNAPVPATLRLPTSAPGSTGSPGFDQALGKWQHIGTRTEDPQPLTIAGLYPPQFILDGKSYVRTAASVTKTCSLAVYGADLQAALQTGHCTQVVRASYMSGDGTMMGTVGVANLSSSNAAQKAGKVTGPQEIIAPLSAKKGATSKLGNGTGVVQAEVKGHYLILMWAEFANLKSPSGAAQRQALEQFADNLVVGSANINLSTRMLSGKP